MVNRSAFLQIRVTPKEKALIRSLARAAGKEISSWALDQLLHREVREFNSIISEIDESSDIQPSLAELNDFLTRLSRDRFLRAIGNRPVAGLSEATWNYIAAMIEHAATLKKLAPPTWTADIPKGQIPYFATNLVSLKPHLLVNSPVAFRRRNIFIDSSIGDRI